MLLIWFFLLLVILWMMTIINLIKISYNFFASNESFNFIINLRDSATGSFTKNFFNS